MKNVKAIFRLIGLYFRLNLSSAMEYRGVCSGFRNGFIQRELCIFLVDCLPADQRHHWRIRFSRCDVYLGGGIVSLWRVSYTVCQHECDYTFDCHRRAGYLSCPAKGYINQSFVCQDIAKRLGGSGIRFYTDGFNPWKGCGLGMFLLAIVIGGLLMTAISVSAHTFTFTSAMLRW